MKHVWGLLLAISLGMSVTVTPAAQPGDYKTNAVFLSGHFLFDSAPFSASARSTDDWAAKSAIYKCPMWFPQAGTIDPANHGVLLHPPTSAQNFLKHVAAYESAHRVSFRLMAVLNGDAQSLDWSDSALESNIVADCGKYLSATVPGSYVTGSPRAFDGCVIDIEPSGTPAVHSRLKTLVVALRASAPFRDGTKKIGIAAPKLKNPKSASGWDWNPSDYYYMGKFVDYILAMTYDSGSTSWQSYQTWMAAQTSDILRSVSGARWKYDANHPKQASGVKVLLGIPGWYPPTTNPHDPSVENAKFAAPGILSGVTSLAGTDSVSPEYLLGAFMFQHDGGFFTYDDSKGNVTPSPFALYRTDWWWWGKYWLGYASPPW